MKTTGDGLSNLSNGQVTRMTPELAPFPNFHTIPTRGLQVLIDLAYISSSTWRFISSTRTQTHDTPARNPLP
ncbi:hypothetical protein TNCV_5023771 [Trichonephila clavipes]|nr:hypothetical protein TNCV_5023771 [Trichonephila clavipes]